MKPLTLIQVNANYFTRHAFTARDIPNQTLRRKIRTNLTADSRESWQAVTRVVVYTVFTRSTVLTRVIDTFIDVF